MAEAIVTFVAMAAIIVVSGTYLTRSADAIAEATGLGRLLVGSVLLAGATSLPELTVDITAVSLKLPDLAVGDLLGSSLMNLLILAGLDLTHHSNGKMLSRMAAAHGLNGLLSIALTSLVGLGLLTARLAPTWDFLGGHISVWLIAIGYCLGVRMVFLDQRMARRAAIEADVPIEKIQTLGPLWRPVLVFFIAAGAILFAGPFLAKSAGRIAELSGLGNTFVGTTLVAFSTSLPELVTSFAAVRLGAFDLAVGNVFGSNAFNMLLFFPLDVFQPGALFASVNSLHAISCLAAIVATSVVVMGQLYQNETRIRVIEPDAILVITLITAALAIIYAAG
jgi:cation:H+ antiporter